jgi:DNA-binding winged helix-turn-helix (wHTH) protein
MPKETQHFYEFEGIRLYTQNAQLVVVKDGRRYSIRPKERDLLTALIRKRGGVVSYDELRQSLWPEFTEVKDILQTIRETKRTLSKLLKDIEKKPEKIIQTVIGEGYRLNVAVVEGWEGEEEDLREENTQSDSNSSLKDDQEDQRVEDVNNESLANIPTYRVAPLSPYQRMSNLEEDMGRLRSVSGRHLWHTLASCTLYALLYSVSVIIEVAYQFERFGSTAVMIASLTFCWVWGTSMCGFGVDWRMTAARKSGGLTFSLLIFVAAALLLYLCLGLFLPGVPITDAKFQTYPAHGAFLKNVYYFLPLAILFMLIPYHFVMAAQSELKDGRGQIMRNVLIGKRMSVSPLGAIYLRLWWLCGLLLLAAAGGAIGIAHLFENLQPNVHMNFFVQLVQWRTVLFFSLGLECMVWYYRMLNHLKVCARNPGT